jgi:hypothetical protein
VISGRRLVMTIFLRQLACGTSEIEFELTTVVPVSPASRARSIRFQAVWGYSLLGRPRYGKQAGHQSRYPRCRPLKNEKIEI